ncbi:MAG: 50S ribosomal protein L10 [Deltaproteobacteria bacterium]|nr:50S ribosomal protein L10 [Deltaproteobacteria bacterium]
MSRTEKAAVVEGLTARLEEAPFVALADYRGISVAEVSDFRSKLKDAGIHYEVIKNKLAKRAITGTDKEVLHDLLVGMTGWIISGEDPIAAAKMLKAETKTLVDEGKFTVKGGFFDGELLDSKGVSDVAELPSKEELFAMLLGLLQQGPRQVLGVVNAPGRDLVNLLKNYETKLAESGE